jgi:hypothetical protein
LSREDVSVPLGGTVEINVQLKVSALAETVTVSGEQPVVDTTTAQVGTNFNRNWVENAPQRRFTFFDLINQAAGVSPSTSDSERSTAFGGNSTDNSYQLDGTDFTAPLTGAAWPWPNTDAIEEVEVLSLGASAEYGNVQGAVFNVVTRQGSNAFHGDGNFYFQHDNLTSRNTTDAEDDGFPYHRDSYVDTTWQVGGPIMKDKFWFFGSFQYQKDSDSPAGSDPAFPAKSLAKRVLGKLNYQFNATHKLQFAYHDDYYDIPDPAQTALTAPSTLVLEHGHNPSPNLTWTSVPTGKTVVEARYSGFYGKDHGDPLQAGEPRVKPRYYDLDTGQVTGGIYSFYDGDIWKTAVSGKISHFAENFLGGSHDVKLGVQYDYGGSRLCHGAERLHLHLRWCARLRLHAGPVAPGRNEDHVGLLRGRHVSHRVAHDAHAWPALTIAAPRGSRRTRCSIASGTRPVSRVRRSTTCSRGTASRRAWASS